MMKDVVGCGIDIEELVRFRTMIPIPPNSRGFSELVYTPEEITCNLGITPGLTFPLSFSCKEAFFKAFGVSWTNSRISWKDIELIFSNSDDLHKYSIRLGGYAEELFHEKKCSLIKSSLGYTDTYVMFQVVLLS
jgi:phosphopantetheine--protein transferase-like protein